MYSSLNSDLSLTLLAITRAKSAQHLSLIYVIGDIILFASLDNVFSLALDPSQSSGGCYQAVPLQ